MPFISEEIWQRVAPLAGIANSKDSSIMLQPYPVPEQSKINVNAIADIEWIKGVIIGIRNIRGEMDIAPGKKLPVYFSHGRRQNQTG